MLIFSSNNKYHPQEIFCHGTHREGFGLAAMLFMSVVAVCVAAS